MSLRKDFVKLRGRSASERRLLVEAMLWLGFARAAILTLPFRWTTRIFALRPGEADAGADQSTCDVAHNIGRALRIASARSPWTSTCLAQALAGAGMLSRRRIPATLAMGVAKSGTGAGSLEAHAWLSCQGTILTGAEGREKFSVVANFTLNRRSGSAEA